MIVGPSQILQYAPRSLDEIDNARQRHDDRLALIALLVLSAVAGALALLVNLIVAGIVLLFMYTDIPRPRLQFNAPFSSKTRQRNQLAYPAVGADIVGHRVHQHRR